MKLKTDFTNSEKRLINNPLILSLTNLYMNKFEAKTKKPVIFPSDMSGQTRCHKEYYAHIGYDRKSTIHNIVLHNDYKILTKTSIKSLIIESCEIMFFNHS